MKIQDIFIIIRKNKKIKENIILLLIITFLLFSALVILTVDNSLIFNINELNEYNLNNRSLVIYDEVNDIETIKNTKHVKDVVQYKQSIFKVESDKYEELVLQPMSNNILKEMADIYNINNYEIICPKLFTPNNDVYNDYNTKMYDIIYTENIINTNIPIYLEKVIYNGFGKEVIDNKEVNLLVVGSYDSAKYKTANNVCFINEDSYNEIVDFGITDDTSLVLQTQVIIDEFSNINEVANALDKLGFAYQTKTTLDVDLITIISEVTFFVLFITIITIFFSINFNIKRNLSMKEEEIFLYRTIGYENKDIKRIFKYELFSIFILATLIAVILFSLIYMIIIYLTNKYIIMQLLTINFNVIILFIIIILGIIVPYIIITLVVNNYLKKRIGRL